MSYYGKLGLQVQQHTSGDIRLMVEGPETFLITLQKVFPEATFSQPFTAQYDPNFAWGVFIKGAGKTTLDQVGRFCSLMRNVIFIDNELDACIALDYHYEEGGSERTTVGTLVYAAKPYSGPVTAHNHAKCRELAQHFAPFIAAHPLYSRADYLVAVPPSRTHKPFDLPTELVRAISSLTGQEVAKGLKKVRTTLPMKDCQTEADKRANINGAFVCEAPLLQGSTVILVDDIYQSGATINEAGRTIRTGGAATVLGLVATKTRH